MSIKRIERSYRRLTAKFIEPGRSNPCLQYEIILKDGLKCFIECSASLRLDSLGEPVGFRGVARNITERKQAEAVLAEAKERAEAATQAKSEFFGQYEP